MINDEYLDWTVRLFKQFDRIMEKDGCVIYNMSYGVENSTCMNLTVAEIIKKTNFTLADIIVWKKKTATPNNVSHNKMTRICEFIYIFCRDDEFNTFKTNKKVLKNRDTGQKIYENIYNYIVADNNDESTDLNKATYSSDLMDKIFNIYVKSDDIILEPFGGTGTTALQCKIKSNKCYSIELSKSQVGYTKKKTK